MLIDQCGEWGECITEDDWTDNDADTSDAPIWHDVDDDYDYDEPEISDFPDPELTVSTSECFKNNYEKTKPRRTPELDTLSDDYIGYTFNDYYTPQEPWPMEDSSPEEKLLSEKYPFFNPVEGFGSPLHGDVIARIFNDGASQYSHSNEGKLLAVPIDHLFYILFHELDEWVSDVYDDAYGIEAHVIEHRNEMFRAFHMRGSIVPSQSTTERINEDRSKPSPLVEAMVVDGEFESEHYHVISDVIQDLVDAGYIELQQFDEHFLPAMVPTRKLMEKLVKLGLITRTGDYN